MGGVTAAWPLFFESLSPRLARGYRLGCREPTASVGFLLKNSLEGTINWLTGRQLF